MTRRARGVGHGFWQPFVASGFSRTVRRASCNSVLLCLVLAGTSWAQPAAPDRTYLGLFAAPSTATPTMVRPAPVNELGLSVRAFGVVEREDAPGADATTRNQTTRQDAGFLAEVSRSHTGRRLSYDVQGASQFRYQQNVSALSVDNQWMAAALRADVTPRTVLSASQRFAYAPLYSPSVGASSGEAQPADGTGAEPGRGATSMTNVTLASVASLSRQVSRRTTAAVEYGYDRLGFSSTGVTVSTHRELATLTRAVRRDLSIQVRQSWLHSLTSGTEAPALVSANDVGAAIDYSLVRARRTTVIVGLAPNLTVRKDPAASTASPAELGSRTSLTMGGYSSIEHQFTTSCLAALAYRRMLYYMPGYTEPILADNVSGTLAGKLHRRVTAGLAAAYSHGTPDVRLSAARVTGLTSSAHVEYRPTRHTSVYAEYVYDTYSVSEEIPQLPGVARDSRRSSLRVGASVSVSPSGSRDANR